jgi:glycosyltransferase involved in cell wall biosynthesis
LPYHPPSTFSFSFSDYIRLAFFNFKSPFLKDDCSRSNLSFEYFCSAPPFIASFVKILLYTDLTIRPDQLFWHRDLGLLTKAFRDLGHEAYLVVHLATEPSATPAIPNELDHTREQPFEAQQGLPRLSEVGPHSTSATSSKIKNPKSSIQDDPVLWVSQQDVLNPCWWKDHHPDLVILGLWTRPKYDPIRQAALSATPHVIERADSDGMRTASCGLLTYAKRRFDYFRDHTYRWPSPFSIPASIFYSFASILATPWIEYRLKKTMELLPSILVETPQATALWKSLVTRLGADPEKIHHVPHPMQTDIFKFDPAVPKKNQIISVGRWDSYQKNLPLLLKTLRTFLDKNSSWTSLVIGSGLPTKSPHPQITILPPLSPPDLARHMQDSKILFSSSRYESFGLAMAEGYACGCAVVGPSEIPALANSLSSENNFLFSSPSHRLMAKLCRASSLHRIPQSYIPSSCTPSEIAQQIIRLSQSIL